MPGISIHVVDVAHGVLAVGMRVRLQALRSPDTWDDIAYGAIGRDEAIFNALAAQVFPAGKYRALFSVADYYRAQGIALPDVPFIDVATYDFGIADPMQHYHLPFKCTPWGFSCFRGGA